MKSVGRLEEGQNHLRHLNGLAFIIILVIPAWAFAQNVTPAYRAPNSGIVSADKRISFYLRAPNAQKVTVVSQGDPAFGSLEMTKDAQGNWSVTTPPMKPDIYSYAFNVDGTSMVDPANTPPLGRGNTSYVYVPGTLWTDTDAPHGAIARHIYKSSIIGGDESFFVYTPPGYDPKRREPYPVLYAFHGLGNTDGGKWIDVVGANLILDNLIAQGKAKPMILVTPMSYGNVGGNAAAGFPNFTRAMLEEIIPMVEKQYNASTKREDRAVTGLSMGAAQSLLMLNHLDKFAWVGSFGLGLDMYDPAWGGGTAAGRGDANQGGGGAAAGRGAVGRGASAAAQAGPRTFTLRPVLAANILPETFPNLNSTTNSQLKLLYIVNGTLDDHLSLARQFRDFLTSRGVKISNYLEPEGVAHNNYQWRTSLADMLPKLFK